MKRLLIVVFVLFYSTLLSAQEKEWRIGYLNQKKESARDSADATFYRTVVEKGDAYIVRDYFITGNIEMMAECSTYSTELIEDGQKTSYYSNGQRRDEGTFTGGEPTGLFRSYYESGILEREIDYRGEEPTYLHSFSRDGHDLLLNGNGIIPDNSSITDGKKYIDIEEGKEFGSFVIYGNGDTVHFKTEYAAEFTGGLSAMEEYLSSAIYYPKKARKKGIQGTVFVGFKIGKQGKIQDVEILKGIDPDCDQVALDVVKNSPDWQPARHRGEVVTTKIVLPVKYRLTLSVPY